MFSQEEIDAALNSAQAAVDTLAGEAARIDGAAPAHGGGPAGHGPGAGKPKSKPRAINRILRIQVPVIVRLTERRMSLKEVLSLSPGTIVEFDRRVGSDLDLLAHNSAIGSGQAIKVGEHYGLKLNSVGSLRERIASLGGS